MADQTLREKLLSANLFRKKQIEIAVPGDDQKRVVEIRCPTVSERNRILKAFQEEAGRGQAITCVLCAKEPGTGAAIFLEADIPALQELPAGGFVDDISAVALGLLNQAEDAAKN